MRCLAAVLAIVVLCGCDRGPSSGAPGGLAKSELTGYSLVRDVKAGEKLEMGMLKSAAVFSKTVKDDVLKDLMLTSADIESFLGKRFKKDANKGDLLEKELFE